MSQFYSTVEDFLDEFRARWGDTDCDSNDKTLIAFLNTALRRLARERGIEKLFRFHDSFELASINTDGQPSHEWSINGDIKSSMNGREISKCIGAILDVYNVTLLDNSGCNLLNQTPCFLEYNDFLLCDGNPQNNKPGNPSNFTISQVGGKNKIIFDRPIAGPKILDLHYSAILPRLREMSDVIRIPWSYLDIVVDMVIILALMEAADDSAARARLEDYDALIDDLRELLAKRPTGTPFRAMNRSF